MFGNLLQSVIENLNVCMCIMPRILPLLQSYMSSVGRGSAAGPFSNRDLRVIADDCWQPPANTYQPMQKKFGSTETTLLVAETKFGYYVQPTVPHYKFQFEDFFGFGLGNIGFHKGRTIFIPK